MVDLERQLLEASRTGDLDTGNVGSVYRVQNINSCQTQVNMFWILKYLFIDKKYTSS